MPRVSDPAGNGPPDVPAAPSGRAGPGRRGLPRGDGHRVQGHRTAHSLVVGGDGEAGQQGAGHGQGLRGAGDEGPGGPIGGLVGASTWSCPTCTGWSADRPVPCPAPGSGNWFRPGWPATGRPSPRQVWRRRRSRATRDRWWPGAWVRPWRRDWCSAGSPRGPRPSRRRPGSGCRSGRRRPWTRCPPSADLRPGPVGQGVLARGSAPPMSLQLQPSGQRSGGGVAPPNWARLSTVATV